MAAVADAEKSNPTAPPADAAAPDIEKGAPASTPSNGGGTGGDGGGAAVVTSVVRRWKREDLLEKSTLVLRALGCFFSLLSFLLMASNRHGDWKDFDLYEEYRYVLAIAILAFLYSTAQVVRQVQRFNTGRDPVPRRFSGILDFAGDQVIAYLLISSLSAAIPLTNRMREGADNMFTDASAASIGISFLAFIALGLSALISGYKLSKQTYI